MTIHAEKTNSGAYRSRHAADTNATTYHSEHAEKTANSEGRWARLKRASAKAGHVILDSILGTNENGTEKQSAGAKIISEQRAEATRKAQLLEAYNSTVEQPGVLAGKRPNDPALRRVRTGVYNGLDGRVAQVAVYDQPERGWAGRGIGVTIAEAVTFDDGAQGIRHYAFSPGYNTELRVATTDYIEGSDGTVYERKNHASWAQTGLKGAAATPEDVALVQHVISPETAWSETVITANPQPQR